MKRTSSQSGSAFFIILLAIAMFAGLSYVVFKGSRTSSNSLSQDQAKLAATEIISFANTVEKAVQTLRLRGCTDTTLNFNNNNISYTNPYAPSDGSCDVFGMNGGKVNAQPADPTAISAANNYPWTGRWVVSATDEIKGIGTSGCGNASCTELILYLWDIKKPVCEEILKLVGMDTGIISVPDLEGGTLFDGIYRTPTNHLGNSTATAKLVSRSAACVRQNSDDQYDFYQVLIAR